MELDQTGLRKAALLLHSLPEAARVGALARLEDARRAVLEPLLQELQTLGVPPGHSWLDLSDLRTESGPHQTVWNLTPDGAAAILGSQSLDTVAAILSLARWPWADELLSQWPADQRSQLRRLTEQSRVVSKPVAETLLTCVADKARQVDAPAEAQSVASADRRRSVGQSLYQRFFGA